MPGLLSHSKKNTAYKNCYTIMHPLLSIKNLSVDFIAESGVTHALKNISISVNRGEIVALVGESGSGKSVTSLSILQLLPSPPAKYSTGEMIWIFHGEILECVEILSS